MNLPRLRALADKYDFLVVIDETIGNFMNVNVLPYADIVASSLTKVFSGDSNVMGGWYVVPSLLALFDVNQIFTASLILNPKGRHYAGLTKHLSTTYEDLYFDEDALFLERNSRDFKQRIKKIDTNAEIICDHLRSRSVSGGASSAVIKKVFYPKWETREHYERCRIKETEDSAGGGFGGLFSLTFTSSAASRAFFDKLPCHKGPSLGSNFTLVCPYTILAHYAELDWAAEYGVEETLVRVSVGMEPTEELLSAFELALRAAEATGSCC